MSVLIITNGHAAQASIERTGIEADILPWEDVLHDGPVPAGLSDTELDDVRARYLASCEWGTFVDIRSRFARRKQILESAGMHDEIVCWFEHDLYDILQLWQVLTSLRISAVNVSLVCHPLFVSHQSPETLQQHFEDRGRVTGSMFDAASQLWTAFRAPSPESLDRLRDTTVLPFTRETIDRWCQQFPARRNGLSRVEETVLLLLKKAGGSMSFGALFSAVGAAEEAAFMGDGSFELILKRLAAYDTPLVTLEDDLAGQTEHLGQQQVRLTPAGAARPDGLLWEWDPVMDRWQGGTRLSRKSMWTYDRSEQQFFNFNKGPSGITREEQM